MLRRSVEFRSRTFAGVSSGSKRSISGKSEIWSQTGTSPTSNYLEIRGHCASAEVNHSKRADSKSDLLQHKVLHWPYLASSLYKLQGYRHSGLCTGRFTRMALPFAPAVTDEVQGCDGGSSVASPVSQSKPICYSFSMFITSLLPALFFARKKSPLWGKDLGKLISFSSPLFRESRKAEQEAGQEGKGKMTMLSKAVKSVLVQLFLSFSPPFSLAPRGGQGVIMIMFSGISISLADLPATKVNPKSQRGGHIHPCLWDSFSEITLSFLWNFPGSGSKKQLKANRFLVWGWEHHSWSMGPRQGTAGDHHLGQQ